MCEVGKVELAAAGEPWGRPRPPFPYDRVDAVTRDAIAHRYPGNRPNLYRKAVSVCFVNAVRAGVRGRGRPPAGGPRPGRRSAGGRAGYDAAVFRDRKRLDPPLRGYHSEQQNTDLRRRTT
jgi:hypothetical protein